ncbi:MAG: hypothetical protein H0X17_04305 [Deltaproteobacteria bacterium]|nr:hypothetical protein [Deltaproteobacteria bacterium]
MTRYFEKFYNDHPMVEIDAETARQRGYYVEELDAPMRYRSFIAGRLDSVKYPGWTDPSEPLADLRARNEGVRGEIYSPVERGGSTKRWRTWFADAKGNVQKILEPEFDDQGRYLRENYRGPDGELRSYMVYAYNEWGELIEVVTYAPDGTVINRHD